MSEIKFFVDVDDARAINEAVAKYQTTSQWEDGRTMIPEGESDLLGAIIGEICRGWMEYIETLK